MKLLEEYIKLVLEAEEANDYAEVDEINALFTQIIKKFNKGEKVFKRPRTLTRVYTIIEPIKANDLLQKSLNDNEFKQRVLHSCIFTDAEQYIQITNAKLYKGYVYDNYRDINIIITFRGMTYAISKEKLRTCMLAAKTADEFFVLLKRATKEI